MGSHVFRSASPQKVAQLLMNQALGSQGRQYVGGFLRTQHTHFLTLTMFQKVCRERLP
jgi:hypothetical protein